MNTTATLYAETPVNRPRRPAARPVPGLVARIWTRPWRALRGEFGSALWVPPCALLLLAAFPPLEWRGLEWLALAPLAAGLLGRRGSVAGWTAAGWGYGVLFFAVQFAWLHHAFVGLAGMAWWQFADAFALLMAVLGLLPAAALGGARWLWRRWGLSPLVVLPVLLAGQDALLGVFPFGGMAWGSLAGPQVGTWAARLVVPLLGGAGLVLLVALVGAGWGAWGWAMGVRGPGRASWAAGAALAGVTLVCAWPAPVPYAPANAPRVPVLLVPGQLSIAQLNAQRDTPGPLRYYLARTMEALPGGAGHYPAAAPPRLVVWPESAVPGQVERGKTLVELSELGGLWGADLLLGSNGLEAGREYNSLYLVNGGRFDFLRYDKQRLVPFGEYVPAGFGWLFARKVTAGPGDYAAGSGPPVLAWRGTRLGLAICFESILPAHVRAEVQAGAALLVAAANDAWLTPAARRQHLQITALRGLAVGRDVVLVANGGWSGLLRGGRAVALESDGTPLHVWAALREGRTLYARWGLLPLGLLSVGLLLGAWRPRRGGRPSRRT
ncbi:MAG TPA: apolipoprotein N-acyltransferase [bacterium]|nr:apolipoprotein N-acyltransferase [bacterium]